VVKLLLTHGAAHSFALGRRKEGAATAGYLLTYAQGEGTGSRMPSVLEMTSKREVDLSCLSEIGQR